MPSKPRILLWGGRSQARLLQAMISDEYGVAPMLIHDATLEHATFETKADFSSELSSLSARIEALNLTHAVVAVGNHHGLARCETADALWEGFGLQPLSLTHDQSWIEPDAAVGVGLQAMPGAVVHRFCALGEHVILNTGCKIDHECRIGRGVHIMGSAALAGRVSVGDYATIGTNATILPDIAIGAGAYVGAGAVVTRDVPKNTVVAGVPARPVREAAPTFDRSTVAFR